MNYFISSSISFTHLKVTGMSFYDRCCAQMQMKCVSTSACEYMGQKFRNYDQIPRELTGCSQVCTCNYGNVTCRDLCEPVPTIPPHDLQCPPEHAVLVTLPGETCCRAWQCATHSVESELLSCRCCIVTIVIFLL